MYSELQKEVTKKAELLGMSEENYLDQLLRDSQLKHNNLQILMEDANGYRNFLQEFQNLIEQVFENMGDLKDLNDPKAMKHGPKKLIHMLNHYITEHPESLMKLYVFYKKDSFD